MNDFAGLERLAKRRNKVLAAMSVLSEAPCPEWVGNREERGKAKGNKSESRAPVSAGVRWTDEGEAKFGRWRGDLPLYDYWLQRFTEDWPNLEWLAETPDDQEIMDWCYDRAYRLVVEAEGDLYAATERAPLKWDVDPIERDKRIIKKHEGKPAIAVAYMEGCSAASVMSVRRQFGRDPLTGKR